MRDTNTEKKDMYTYLEATQVLNRSLSTIKQAVTAEVLHPVKLPHIQHKFLTSEEVEWFRGKDLTPANAEALKRHQDERQGRTSQPTIPLTEVLNSSLGQQLIKVLFVIGALWALKQGGDEMRDKLFSSMIDYLKNTEHPTEDKPLFRQMANNIVETLTREGDSLSPTDRKVYKELLDALLAASADELALTHA